MHNGHRIGHIVYGPLVVACWLVQTNYIVDCSAVGVIDVLNSACLTPNWKPLTSFLVNKIIIIITTTLFLIYLFKKNKKTPTLYSIKKVENNWNIKGKSELFILHNDNVIFPK